MRNRPAGIELRLVAALAAAGLLCACDPGHATFVTATNIGITADAHTEELQIGYVRAELFYGPNYVDVGEAPQAVGFLDSNLSAFAPKVKQLYATGDAAHLVTYGTEPPLNDEPVPGLTGARRQMVFGTGTSFGLKVGFTGEAPSSLKFGYNREELSIIPFRAAPPGSGQADKYASVIASIDLNTQVTTEIGSAAHLTQFFATGAAARNLARRADIRNIFGTQADIAVEQAALQETVKKMKELILTGSDAINAYFDQSSAPDFAAARDRLLDNSTLAPNDPVYLALKKTKTKEEFMKYLQENKTVIRTLSRSVSKLKT